MIRPAALAGLCAAVVGLVVGCSVFGRSDAHAGRPALRVVRTAPLVVRGDHFRSGERVRISAAARSARSRANGDGYFVVTIRGATRCDATRVLARGSAGSYAVAKLLPPPACLPARSG